MNAEQDNVNVRPPARAGVPFHSDPDTDLAVALSALTDGEIGAGELDALLADADHRSELHADWHAYQVIGDVLRGTAPAVSNVAPQAFVAGISARLQLAEWPQSRSASPVVMAQVRGAAANDPVMRWKMAAGLASLAAVVAVSWSVMQGASVQGGPAVSGPQLAQVAPSTDPAKPVVAASDTGSTNVAVSTGQGILIRDARLEQMLAEHRQYGGMSALQMPAGFLRNATYDTAPQR
ncbi:MAG: sigma-E factor negative regulatory protein [Hydrogenophaga sp.]|jgi:sigma-E factor negative regulatory protein RseA|nr:sigma-E factor negative regulatory protein [Hydrogenophaga sp.]